MTNQLTKIEPQAMAVAPQPSPASILQAVVEKGINSENVAVVKELMGMCREVRAEEAKAAFAKAFFALRRDLKPIYADKEVKTKTGVAFEYCSPQEIKNTVELLMERHGFCTMAGQTMADDGRSVTVSVTLYHESGHSETRAFSTMISPGNQLMTVTQAVGAASSNAERHCLIKLFGLRTRSSKSEDDPRNLGEEITVEQARDFQTRVAETGSDERGFLKYAGVTLGENEQPTFDHYTRIMSGKHAALDASLKRKEGRK